MLQASHERLGIPKLLSRSVWLDTSQNVDIFRVLTLSEHVIARRAFCLHCAHRCARRSNPLADMGIASGWKKHPALAMTKYIRICQAIMLKPWWTSSRQNKSNHGCLLISVHALRSYAQVPPVACPLLFHPPNRMARSAVVLYAMACRDRLPGLVAGFSSVQVSVL